MSCERRKVRGQTWAGDAPKCGFPDGVFDRDNWNCATLNALRDLSGAPTWSEDQNAMLLPLDGSYVLLSWYKNRGRTEGAWLMSSSRIESLTLDDAERMIAELSKNEEQNDQP
jgi:hypothetical protein